MRDYSLERIAEQIPDPQTRAHFQEVLECYWRENSRAALVTLWVVLVFDLLRKLEAARVEYDDSKAEGILAEIQSLRDKDSRSSKWEWKLIELIHERTDYLSTVDFERLEGIQRFRHLAAHPTLDDDGASLYVPSSETVRAKLQDALEVVLLKPGFMTRDVFVSFIEELERLKGTFATTERLQLHLERKYFDRVPEPVEDSIFRSLWKLVFRNRGEREDSNRNINYEALTILYERNRRARREQIEGEPLYFGDIEGTGQPIELLVQFILCYPAVYDILDGARPAVEQYLEETPELCAANWLGQKSIHRYLADLADNLDSEESQYYVSDKPRDFEDRTLLHPKALEIIVTKGMAIDAGKLSKRIAIAAYRRASSYDAADGVFSNGIEPQLREMGRNDFEKLLAAIEENHETYERRRARQDHPLVKERCDCVLGEDFDYSEYPKFVRSIGGRP